MRSHALIFPGHVLSRAALPRRGPFCDIPAFGHAIREVCVIRGSHFRDSSLLCASVSRLLGASVTKLRGSVPNPLPL
jgi:hypothetical protein